MQNLPPAGVQRMIALALRHHQSGQLGEAEQIYRRILQSDPRNADALHLLGVIAFQMGRLETAADLIARAIALNDGHSGFHNNLANVLKAQGKFSDAERSYLRALSLKPDQADAHYNLGITLQAQGKLQDAAASYRRALAVHPGFADAHNNLGNVLRSQGEIQGAEGCYRQALRLRANYPEAQINIGNILSAQGKLDEGMVLFRQVLTANPGNAEAHYNLGLAFLDKGMVDEAAESFRSATEHKAGYLQAHMALANTLRELGKSKQAMECYRRALTSDPDQPAARLGLALATIPVMTLNVSESRAVAAEFSDALHDLAAWAGRQQEKLGSTVGSQQPFYLAYRPDDCTSNLARYGELICTAAKSHWVSEATDPPARRVSRPRIRLGVISGQARRHPVWDVILHGILAQLDRGRFEIIFYHTKAVVDAETTWARAHTDRFVQGPKSTELWLREIREDRPDVLFYPEVGMDPASCALAALRLAPLQVASWGHPVTSGLPTVDVFMSGDLLESSAAGGHYTERLVRLPGTGVCTSSPDVCAVPWARFDAQSGVIRFAVCHQPMKFDPQDDVLFAQIAKRVGPCEFWLASPRNLIWAASALHERLAATFRESGLDPARHIRVTPWLKEEEFLGFLDEMDVYLDCPAFSGYTTAWQAAHRGLPIVTLEGVFMRQRLAAGLLRQMGMTDGIAVSRDEYVNAAVRSAEECRTNERARNREAMRQAARNADGNTRAIDAWAQAIAEAIPLS
jgi:protein O-GlcNAc transferase